jgi:hypothetical protein
LRLAQFLGFIWNKYKDANKLRIEGRRNHKDTKATKIRNNKPCYFVSLVFFVVKIFGCPGKARAMKQWAQTPIASATMPASFPPASKECGQPFNAAPEDISLLVCGMKLR